MTSLEQKERKFLEKKHELYFANVIFCIQLPLALAFANKCEIMI